ncbi:cation diffusion facilitator CzcD-associated flavoprotein CzcO [Aminobacter niigataensis]|uniref:Cation diffusion facilitator CzcD-associated flavoprotein CzcO n=1 Tax=Aminobacter niigataensis TaxID=83265 RepID=A0ABR6L9K1_9HYPH|nr:NAD(P)-binding domain-containing protein [Aminobacter niigataensis]MBB4653494.1 cation diffusion facilitator CzcD-associated flavoprotein CzcO [Aminobacter niigataensis]
MSHSLPVTLGADVVALKKDERGFRATLVNGLTICSRNVVIATGGFQKSLRTQVSAGFGRSVLQLDPETYRNPSSVPSGRVLVVGDGASGRDIAAELAVTNEVWIATGKPRRLFPERILGKSVWWWLNRVGLMRASPGPRDDWQRFLTAPGSMSMLSSGPQGTAMILLG